MTSPLPVVTAVESPRAPVVVVDDEPRTAQVLAELLAMDGLDVEVCAAARLSDRLAGGPTPGGLVMNVSMARADDVRVVRQVRAEHPALPVFIVTEYPHLATRLGPQLAAQAAVFTKPVDYPALLGVLRMATAPLHLQMAQAQESPW